MPGQQEHSELADAPASPAWLWAARAAAVVSLVVLAGPPLSSGRLSLSEPGFQLGSALALAYGVVLLLLAFRNPPWVFGAGLRVGALVALVVLLATLLVGALAGSGLPRFVAAGLAQLVLIGACTRLARSRPASGRLLGYALGVPLVFVLLFVTVLGRIFHHPPRYDSHAIGDLRSFASAQAVYEYQNLLYGSPACLARPVDCIPGYPEDAPLFFGPEAPAVRSAYLRVFHPGPAATAVDPQGVEHAGVRSWALTAAPLREGYRGFCIDASGAILYTRDGGVPPVEEGACARGPGVELLE